MDIRRISKEYALMTEDDTFLKLKKVTRNEMSSIWENSPIPGCKVPACPENVRNDIKALFRQHGWEFIDWLSKTHTQNHDD